MTSAGTKKMVDITAGDQFPGLETRTRSYQPFTVWYKYEQADDVQEVYNIEDAGGPTFVMNGVSVLQK